MGEDVFVKQASVIRVAENANWGHAQRMFPYHTGPNGTGRVLRSQASVETNPPEVRLQTAADAQRYDQIGCGLLSFRDQCQGSCFPLTPVSGHKAVRMTCKHVTRGKLDLQC